MTKTSERCSRHIPAAKRICGRNDVELIHDRRPFLHACPQLRWCCRLSSPKLPGGWSGGHQRMPENHPCQSEDSSGLLPYHERLGGQSAMDVCSRLANDVLQPAGRYDSSWSRLAKVPIRNEAPYLNTWKEQAKVIRNNQIRGKKIEDNQINMAIWNLAPILTVMKERIFEDVQRRMCVRKQRHFSRLLSQTFGTLNSLNYFLFSWTKTLQIKYSNVSSLLFSGEKWNVVNGEKLFLLYIIERSRMFENLLVNPMENPSRWWWECSRWFWMLNDIITWNLHKFNLNYEISWAQFQVFVLNRRKVLTFYDLLIGQFHLYPWYCISWSLICRFYFFCSLLKFYLSNELSSGQISYLTQWMIRTTKLGELPLINFYYIVSKQL